MILATAISTNATSSASNSTTTSTAGSNTSKISLVPTNILMKPSTNQSQSNSTQFSFKPQQFLCAKSASGTPTVYTSSSGGMPMKVLLVNTLQKPNASTATTVQSSITQPILSTPLATRPLVSIQPKPQNNAHPVIQSTYQTRSATAASASAQASKAPTVISTNRYLYSGGAPPDPADKRTLSFKQKSTPGFRSLLNQLVQLQSKQLDVSRQRLAVERERLEFERNTGEKILTTLTSLLQNKIETKEEK